MNRRHILLQMVVWTVVVGASGVWLSPADGFPEPAVVSKAWAFEFSHGTPQPIAIVDGTGNTTWYWYMTYKVENNTDADRLFIPEIVVANDSGETAIAGGTVPVAVFNQIKERVGNPLLIHPALVIDLMRQGPDHAKESVAVWPVSEQDVDQLTVFVSGLSGETQQIPDPLTGERVLMRRTLMIDYDTPGTSTAIQGQPVLARGERWIMR